MPNRLDEVAEVFQSVEPETRLELLLDYSRKLPPLPARLTTQRDAGLHRVHECMTPVFLWVEAEGDKLRLWIDVAPESPTVAGMLAIVVEALDGRPIEAVKDLPLDLIQKLALADVLRMNRAVGIGAILGRIKREAATLAASSQSNALQS
ncbi:MAG: SufE family protein [Phycisphaeraceae bacterium]|nr:SufE family protein [Phycisphaeraceae bacterium]